MNEKKYFVIFRYLFSCFFILVLKPSWANEIQTMTQGEVGGFLTVYPSDSNIKDVKTYDEQLGLQGKLIFNAKKDQYALITRSNAIVDFINSNRNRFVIEDLYFRYQENKIQVKAGFQLFNFRQFEGFYPLDQINPRILDGNLSRPIKKGTPSVSLSYDFNERLRVTGLIIPRAQLPSYPKKGHRYYSSLYEYNKRFVDDGSSSSSKNNFQSGFFIDYTQNKFDLKASFLKIIDKNRPSLANSTINFLPTPPTLYFHEMKQYSLFGNYQLADDLIAKGEFVSRTYDSLNGLHQYFFKVEDHQLSVIGLEKQNTIKGYTLTTFLEWKKIYHDSSSVSRKLSPFQNDLFTAFKLDLNDYYSSSFILGYYLDLRKFNEHLLVFNYERRIFDAFKISAEALVIIDREKSADYSWPYQYRDDHQLTVMAKWFF